MAHPYVEFEGSPLWRVLDQTLASLEANGDLVLQTARQYVLGALCRQLAEDRVVSQSPMGSSPVPPTRSGFAGFLDRVADGSTDVGDWQDLMATHYHDPVLEAARVRAVRLAMAIPVGAVLAPDACEQLRALAREVRESPA